MGKTGTTPYGDFVLMTDAVVGQLVQAVEKAGLAQNTLIIFTSDNGAAPAANLEQLKQKGHLANYIFRGNKADIYEGGHRVPFIAKWPAMIRAGAVSEATISLTDFMATAAALTNQNWQPTKAKIVLVYCHYLRVQKVIGVNTRYSILFLETFQSVTQIGNWRFPMDPVAGAPR
ncbi:sulfatase-like hydrolase/transferase [Sphingobacterium sp. E70]|uniref:sulfatase-like hydrolase/transferase n=1 Tax=Sphingobacterium sp. E70 TaxID=2853439 RepID=UPI00211C80A9|nr:sulfatase-like hydrolase/transferase [Sphingobacterium sp. E70]ULT29158.1 sulfatase-like hydrolase/transferase [Sphingobacterium sp. E70]